jgi:hypothetical protein
MWLRERNILRPFHRPHDASQRCAKMYAARCLRFCRKSKAQTVAKSIVHAENAR